MIRALRCAFFCLAVYVRFSSPCLAQLRTVALTGQAADSGGGPALTFFRMGTATMNDAGQVALVATVQQEGGAETSGVWSEGAGEGLELVARQGEAAPGAPSGATYASMITVYPAINNAGQVSFHATLSTGPGGVTTSNNSGVWIGNPGELPQLIIREGDHAPETPAGTQFDAQDEVIQRQFNMFNENGQVLLRTQLKVGAGGVTSSSETGIWRAGIGHNTRLIARENSPAPGTTLLFGHMAAVPRLNDVGGGTFYAPLKFLGMGQGNGVWQFGADGTATLITRTGQPAPGIVGSVPFATLSTPTINNVGDIAFYGSVASGGAIDATNDAGIWVRRGGDSLQLLIRESDPAPGLGPAIGIGTAAPLAINSAGRLTFRSILQTIPDMGPSGINTNNDSTIWAERPNGAMQLVAREGDTPPGVPASAEYASFTDPAINGLGQIAFIANLRGTDVTMANDGGIWAEDTSGVLHLIAREGDMLDVDDGPGTDLRTISQLFFYADTGNEDGRKSGFNEHGQLAFTAAFTDNTAGVFVTDRVRAALAGDFNGDGTVDAADYVVWRKNDGTPDGYNTWRANFGRAPAAGTIIGEVVPEPVSLVALLIAAVGFNLVGPLRRRTFVRLRQ